MLGQTFRKHKTKVPFSQALTEVKARLGQFQVFDPVTTANVTATKREDLAAATAVTRTVSPAYMGSRSVSGSKVGFHPMEQGHSEA